MDPEDVFQAKTVSSGKLKIVPLDENGQPDYSKATDLSTTISGVSLDPAPHIGAWAPPPMKVTWSAPASPKPQWVKDLLSPGYSTYPHSGVDYYPPQQKKMRYTVKQMLKHTQEGAYGPVKAVQQVDMAIFPVEAHQDQDLRLTVDAEKVMEPEIVEYDQEDVETLARALYGSDGPVEVALMKNFLDTPAFREFVLKRQYRILDWLWDQFKIRIHWRTKSPYHSSNLHF